jgi:hypothetical protein
VITYTATVHPDGTAQITTPTSTHTIGGDDVADARRQVVEHLADTARQHSHVLRVIATDPEGTHELDVHPDGTIDVLEHDVLSTGIEDLEDTRPHPLMPTAPRALRLTFNTQPDTVITTRAAIGRSPDLSDGRDAIQVLSPERMLSRTHALVDIDEAGRIVLTDNHSGNGTELQRDPPMRLTPGHPQVIEPGTTVLMGDVACTIDLV